MKALYKNRKYIELLLRRKMLTPFLSKPLLLIYQERLMVTIFLTS